MKKIAYLHHIENKSKEPLWHVQLAIVLIIILQLTLSTKLTVGPKYLIAGLEFILLGFLMVIAYSSTGLILRRTLALTLIGLISFFNVTSLFLVSESLFKHTVINGQNLLISALTIYITNIIVFGLWYWEMEFRRSSTPLDFLFPNENAPEHTGLHRTGWRPTFFDYLYISITNGTAFSPTDTLPLTHRAKLLMSIQSFISLIIIVLVTARAVSIIV